MPMYLNIKMDRKIDTNKHYISPGGFEIKFDDGKTIAFDFNESESWVDETNKDVMCFRLKDLDNESFPDAKTLPEYLQKHKVTEVVECYVYTGEDNEPKINPIEIENMTFDFNEYVTEIPSHILKQYHFDK